ncbi:hypothetical protein [Amycolatopsis magusensis]|uniref:hypothetical protein n=1 Tax=Amycolatopsis magusensis TaxID=882444 RepID=UPI003C30C0BA
MSLLSLPREIRLMRALSKEAKRRGISYDELSATISTEELVLLEGKQPDVRRWGLFPDEEITAAAPESRTVAAVRAGDWRPAAAALAERTDWDRRAAEVDALAEVAAEDNTWLRTWRAQAPGDVNALVVQAQALVRLAWNRRGSARASDTSPEQFAAFRRALIDAHKAAELACDAVPEDPTPWLSLVTMARGLQVGHERFRQWWAGLVARAPAHRAGHDEALQYWCAKWAGSDEQMFGFAEAAAANHPALSSLPLQAAYEASAKNPKVWLDRRIHQQTDALLAWLSGDGATSPYARTDRSIAALVLLETKRYDQAVEQFRHVGRHADAWIWHDDEFPRLKFLLARGEACRRARRP